MPVDGPVKVTHLSGHSTDSSLIDRAGVGMAPREMRTKAHSKIRTKSATAAKNGLRRVSMTDLPPINSDSRLLPAYAKGTPSFEGQYSPRNVTHKPLTNPASNSVTCNIASPIADRERGEEQTEKGSPRATQRPGSSVCRQVPSDTQPLLSRARTATAPAILRSDPAPAMLTSSSQSRIETLPASKTDTSQKPSAPSAPRAKFSLGGAALMPSISSSKPNNSRSWGNSHANTAPKTLNSPPLRTLRRRVKSSPAHKQSGHYNETSRFGPRQTARRNSLSDVAVKKSVASNRLSMENLTILGGSADDSDEEKESRIKEWLSEVDESSYSAQPFSDSLPSLPTQRDTAIHVVYDGD